LTAPLSTKKGEASSFLTIPDGNRLGPTKKDMGVEGVKVAFFSYEISSFHFLKNRF